MRSVFLITAIAVLCTASPQSDSVLPLVFEPNVGQAAREFDYISRTQQGTVLVAESGVLLMPSRAKRPVRMTIAGASPAKPQPLDRQAGASNYFVSSDRTKWRTEIPHYSKIKYANIYPGIDLVYYGTGQQLEYDFVVSPGRAFSSIELAFEGARRLRTDKRGNLLIDLNGQTIRQLRPRVYQRVNGQEREIAGGYKVLAGNRVRFTLGAYDRNREVVIDPVIQFATYIGREGHDVAVAVASDSVGNAYIAGSTNSLQLATSGAAYTERRPETDAFVAKVTPAGVQYLTYFGGSGSDTGLGIGVDSSGNAYLGGSTASTNLPAENGAQSSPAGGLDGFVAKFDSNGSRLLWATYAGGSGEDWGSSLAVDAQGGAWLSGWTRSTDFPRVRAFQNGTAGGGGDAFITRVSPGGNSFTYSTYFGAEGVDLGSGIAVDAQGMVYISGSTTSNRLPVGGATRTPLAGEQDAFVVKLNPATNEVIFGRLLGGTGEELGTRIAADSNGNAYVVGHTKSPTFPATRGSVQSSFAGNVDIFVAKLNGATGATEYATFLGGVGDDWPGSIAVDQAGSAYISGWTNSANFPVRNAMQQTYSGGGGFDAIVARLSPGGDSLLYSTFYGGTGDDRAYGLALSPSGHVVISGITTTTTLPGATGSFTPGSAGNTDVFVARLSPDTSVALVAAQPSSITLTARLGENTVQPASIALTSTGAGTAYTAASNAAWLTVTPENGQIPTNLSISVSPGSLPPGPSTAEVTVRSPSGAITIPVTVNVIVAPAISSATPPAIPPGAGPATLTLTGAGYIAQTAVEVNGVLVPSTLIDSSNLRVTVPADLTRTEGVLNVVAINPDARSAVFPINVAANLPALAASGVLHGATNAPGPVAPGQIVVLTGTGFGPDTLIESASGADGRRPTALAETIVRFDETPAPVLWAHAGKIAVIVPYGVSGRTATQISVEFRGRRSPSVPVAVQSAAPGIFTADGTGRGQAAALNQDGSPNSAQNPASRGSVIVLYTTGEGQVTPALPDGSAVPASALTRPVLPVSVTIGGVPADVRYAGGAPGLVSGLLQINVAIPGNTPEGPAQVVVSVGNQTSPSGTTISIR